MCSHTFFSQVSSPEEKEVDEDDDEFGEDYVYSRVPNSVSSSSSRRRIEEDNMVMVPTWFWPVEESSIASPLKRIQERIGEMETIRALPPQPKEPVKVGPQQSKDTGNVILQLPMEVQKRVHRSPGPEFQTMLARCGKNQGCRSCS